MCKLTPVGGMKTMSEKKKNFSEKIKKISLFMSEKNNITSRTSDIYLLKYKNKI